MEDQSKDKVKTVKPFEIRFPRPLEETIQENGNTALFQCYYCNNMVPEAGKTKVFTMPGKAGIYGYHSCKKEECLEKYSRSVLYVPKQTE